MLMAIAVKIIPVSRYAAVKIRGPKKRENRTAKSSTPPVKSHAVNTAPAHTPALEGSLLMINITESTSPRLAPTARQSAELPAAR